MDTLVTCLSSGQHRQEKVNVEKLDLSCGHRGASWVHGCRTPATAGLTVTKTCQVSSFPDNHKHLFDGRLSVGIKQPREAKRKISVDAQRFLPQDKHLGSWKFFFFFFGFSFGSAEAKETISPFSLSFKLAREMF